MITEPIYYFGCLDVPGHSLHGSPRLKLQDTPWGTQLDGGLLKNTPDVVDGTVVLHWKEGWTAAAFWDRSGDSRGGSCSVFLVHQTVNWIQLLERVAMEWPMVVNCPGSPRPILFHCNPAALAHWRELQLKFLSHAQSILSRPS